MEVRKIELVRRVLEGVQFTEENAKDLVQWVQDRTVNGVVVMGDHTIYIQGVAGTEAVTMGDWVLYDEVDKTFTSATDGAVRAFYRTVKDD